MVRSVASSFVQCLLLALGSSLIACGPAGLSVSGAGGSTIAVGGGHHSIETVTDLDTVRGVAMSSDRVYVATDLGLLLHFPTGGEGMERITVARGLPSNDVRDVVVDDQGMALVATARGIVKVDGEGTVAAWADAPPVGSVSAILLAANGALWAGGTEGLARYTEGAWVRFGEAAAVTTLVETPEGGLWVGTMRGLFFVEGDVIREHAIGAGIPEAYVRSIVPVRPGEIFALLQGPTDSQIGYWDGARWFGYTVDLDAPAIALTRRGDDYLLITPANAFVIEPQTHPGAVVLTALTAGELRGVRSFGARVLAVDELEPPASGQEPPTSVVRAPSRLAAVPEGRRPDVDAPAFEIRPVTLDMPIATYWAEGIGDDLFLADRNRGVKKLNPTGLSATLESRDLVPTRDLQIAIDAAQNTWLLGRDNALAVHRNGYIERVPAPEGVEIQCLASGPDGAYVLTLVTGQAGLVRLYRVTGDGWTQQMERQLEVSPPLTSIEFFGMTDERQVWAGLRVVNEMGESPRLRGLAVFGEEGDILYHHRAADPAATPGALQMPDEVENIDLGAEGYAWFPSLYGAIRLGNSQAVVFGEARGVRGEVVSAVAVGDFGRVWVAAAEGLGYYEDSSFDFHLPEIVQRSRPTALALDSEGHVWAAGLNGVAYHDGEAWHRLTEETGLPTNQLVDVEVDARDRVWLLAEDRLMVFSRAQAPSME